MREMAKTFIDALTKLESTGESDLMERLFAEEAEIINPLTQQRGGGTETARRFWETYRQSFNSINSSFLNVIEQDDVVVLEWVSEGSASDGPFRYEGVTILKCRRDKVACFRTCFNPVRVRSGASRASILQRILPRLKQRPPRAEKMAAINSERDRPVWIPT